jgi:hypothetical protein
MAPMKTDLSKLNDVAANLDSRLMGGLHEEFCEEGSKFGDKNRHEQLATLFELKQQITSIQTEMQKKQRAEEDEDKNSKGLGKTNKNLIKTIRSVVEQEMSDKLRTLSIENERLRESLKKTQDLCEAFEGRVKGLEAKLKKFEQQEKAVKVAEGKFKAVQSEVTRMEQELATKAQFEKVHQQVQRSSKTYNNNREVCGTDLLQLKSGSMNSRQAIRTSKTDLMKLMIGPQITSIITIRN